MFMYIFKIFGRSDRTSFRRIHPAIPCKISGSLKEIKLTSIISLIFDFHDIEEGYTYLLIKVIHVFSMSTWTTPTTISEKITNVRSACRIFYQLFHQFGPCIVRYTWTRPFLSFHFWKIVLILFHSFGNTIPSQSRLVEENWSNRFHQSRSVRKGPLQPSCFCCAELNSRIKSDISTTEVRHLFSKRLSSTNSTVLHDSGTAGRDSYLVASVARCILARLRSRGVKKWIITTLP